MRDEPLSDSGDFVAQAKWDAWRSEQGINQTEAKRRYVSYLIDTMKIYASGTHEARELLSELEDLWDQIKHVKDDAGHLPETAGRSSPFLLSRMRNTTPILPENASLRDQSILSSPQGEGRRNSYVELVKWQNEVNNTLVKLTQDISKLQNEKRYWLPKQCHLKLLKPAFLKLIGKVITINTVLVVVALTILRRRVQVRKRDSLNTEKVSILEFFSLLFKVQKIMIEQ